MRAQLAQPSSLPNPAYATVYSFAGGTNGDSPTSDLVLPSPTPGVTPLLYGTTYGGGATAGPSPDPCAQGCGTVYTIDPATMHEHVVWRFQGAPQHDGAIPVGAVSLVDGAIYGTTAYGGTKNSTACPHGCGTIFKIDPSGHESIIHSFAGGMDGANPAGALRSAGSSSTLASRGASSSAPTFYGTTEYGGAKDFGTVFTLGPAGFKTLYSFEGRPNGEYPVRDLIVNGTTLYGVTSLGGKYGLGAVYRIIVGSSVKESIIYSFDVKKGDSPVGLESSKVGGTLMLYVAASADGPHGKGSIIALSVGSGVSLKWVYGFKGKTRGGKAHGGTIDGATPYAQPRLYKSFLYGTTQRGGEYSAGTIYRIGTSGAPGSECVLHPFAQSAGENGALPVSPLRAWKVGSEYRFYGATVAGGANGLGVVYEIPAPSKCP
jgi:uncharacterized repeat protein (TIGR03803 family)